VRVICALDSTRTAYIALVAARTLAPDESPDGVKVSNHHETYVEKLGGVPRPPVTAPARSALQLDGWPDHDEMRWACHLGRDRAHW
jgi:hypothetical protein